MSTYKPHFYRNSSNGQIVHCGESMSDEWVRVSDANGKRLMRLQTIEELRRILKPGQTVYCTLRSVSRSGMQRRISLHTVNNGELISLDWYAARCMHYRQSDKGGLIVNGCGMDMGFALVYDLGATVWPEGTTKPHAMRNGEPDTAGCYALKSVWI